MFAFQPVCITNTKMMRCIYRCCTPSATGLSRTTQFIHSIDHLTLRPPFSPFGHSLVTRQRVDRRVHHQGDMYRRCRRSDLSVRTAPNERPTSPRASCTMVDCGPYACAGSIYATTAHPSSGSTHGDALELCRHTATLNDVLGGYCTHLP